MTSPTAITAARFWSSVTYNDGLRRDQPESALRRFLQANTASSAVAAGEYAARVAQAWNAFYAGRPLTVLAGGKYLNVEGSPFDGKKTDVGFTMLGLEKMPRAADGTMRFNKVQTEDDTNRPTGQ